MIGLGMGYYFHGFSIRVCVTSVLHTTCALDITRDLGNIIQLSNAKQSCANFHFPVN